MMFRSYYGMSFNPFDKQQVKAQDAFISKDHKEMATRLSHLMDVRGIGVFTAHPGFGKTFALRCFAEGLNPRLCKMEYVPMSTVSVMDFYRQFCSLVGADISYRKSTMFESIQERVLTLYKEKKRPLILAVDEAHELNADILKDLKMLMNQEYDHVNCFTLILIGEPHLNHILEKPVHEALRQRIAIHYTMGGLGDEEVPLYIAHKLRSAGASEDIIDTAAAGSIHGYSRGNPRLIDNLMTDALLLGAQTGRKTLDPEIILAAVNNQNLG
jgi:type II secretory pathway predicted ATPase ExeA